VANHTESDIGAAAFLLTRGFKLVGLTRLGPHRYGFCFSDPDNSAAQETRSYFDGATAEAKALLDSLRDLKNRLYAEKANGNGNETRTHFH
jgi:hypothetical protein